jgi:hypothetical protein
VVYPVVSVGTKPPLVHVVDVRINHATVCAWHASCVSRVCACESVSSLVERVCAFKLVSLLGFDRVQV